jgi:TolB-like protein/DNA-binding winged helix-turn-helix (wHTH) protein/Flp pilus assembly protein TadD
MVLPTLIAFTRVLPSVGLDCACARKGVKQGPTIPPDTVILPGNGPQPPVYRVGDLVVDTGQATVTRDGQALALPKLTFDLLLALIEAAPRVLSHDELMHRVWPGLVVGPETVSQRVKLLRAGLDDDPKAPRYVLGVRGRGYRLLPEVVRLDSSGVNAFAAPDTDGPAARERWRPPRLLVAAVALIAAVVIGMLVSRMNSPDRSGATTPAQPLPARSVAVLAFKDRGSAEGNGFLADGIPENVLHQLARFPGLTVIARGSSFAFRDSDEDLRSIGRKLNARYLLEGSVQTAGQELRVTSSLVDAETGASVWSMKFERSLRDVFAVEDEIAAEVAKAMKISIDEGTAALATRARDSDQAFDAYLSFLRGRALHASQRLADLPLAVDSLSSAIRQDPQFAAAYVLLARARVELAERESPESAVGGLAEAVENSLQLLDTAIKLEPSNGEAYVERGYLKAFYDVAAADADFRRGLALAPSSARGYEGLAAVLFQSVARRREALALLEKARQLNPIEPRLDVVKATYLAYGPGDSEQATAILQQVLERDPLYVPALVRLAELRWGLQGRSAETIYLGEQAVKLDPGNEQAWYLIGAGYLDAGDLASAEAAFRGIREPSNSGPMYLHLHRKQWRAAGEAAYGMLAAGTVRRINERAVAAAVRMHARASVDHDRAIRTLEAWTTVTWEGDEPRLGDSLGQRLAETGLADIMRMAGEPDRAKALAREVLHDIDIQTDRYGRGGVWLDAGRALALMLLDRPDDALAVLQRQVRAGMGLHDWRFPLLDDPLFEPLRKHPEFRELVAMARSNAARQNEKIAQMRADGRIPDRR